MMSEVVMRTITSILGGIFFFGMYFVYPSYFTYVLLLLLLYTLLHELPRFFGKQSTLRKIPWNMITLAYPLFSLGALWYLYAHHYSQNILIPLYPYLAAWIFDTGSYCCGKIFGKHRITSISPKKTWEGVFGGYAGLLFFNGWLFTKMTFIESAFFSALIASAAFSGDLFESYLKRKAQIKQSGTLLPGHGGVLDRFDSVFFVALVLLAILHSSKILTLFYLF